MGGERAGKEASSLAIDEFFQHFSESYSGNLDDEAIRNLLIKSVSAANTVIYTRARLDFKNFGMGTTCVAAFVTANTAYIINVGDSRAYLIAENGLHRITTDHNVSTLLFEQGKITEEEVENHPQKHMLVRAVGVEKTVTADTFILDYTDKISLLLCSDGLSGYCSDDEIYSVIAKAEFDDIAQELINLALNKGGRDNVTVAVISD
jgi:protein phosphatase